MATAVPNQPKAVTLPKVPTTMPAPRSTKSRRTGAATKATTANGPIA